MAFTDMKVKELREIAEEFGVDLEGAKNKSAIIATLVEEGVTEEEYERVMALEKEDEEVIEEMFPEPVEPETPVVQGKVQPVVNEMLVKMERANFTFQTHGVTFTQEHPFAVMSYEKAQAIFDTEEGFRPATPRELEDYYS